MFKLNREQLAQDRITLRWQWMKWTDTVIPMQIAWALPRRLVLWCAVRVAAHATTGQFGTTDPNTLSAMDMLARWAIQEGD